MLSSPHLRARGQIPVHRSTLASEFSEIKSILDDLDIPEPISGRVSDAKEHMDQLLSKFDKLIGSTVEKRSEMDVLETVDTLGICQEMSISEREEIRGLFEELGVSPEKADLRLGRLDQAIGIMDITIKTASSDPWSYMDSIDIDKISLKEMVVKFPPTNASNFTSFLERASLPLDQRLSLLVDKGERLELMSKFPTFPEKLIVSSALLKDAFIWQSPVVSTFSMTKMEDLSSVESLFSNPTYSSLNFWEGTLFVGLMTGVVDEEYIDSLTMYSGGLHESGLPILEVCAMKTPARIWEEMGFYSAPEVESLESIPAGNLVFYVPTDPDTGALKFSPPPGNLGILGMYPRDAAVSQALFENLSVVDVIQVSSSGNKAVINTEAFRLFLADGGGLEGLVSTLPNELVASRDLKSVCDVLTKGAKHPFRDFSLSMLPKNSDGSNKAVVDCLVGEGIIELVGTKKAKVIGAQAPRAMDSIAIRTLLSDIVYESSRSKVVATAAHTLNNACEEMEYHTALDKPYPAHVSMSLGDGKCLSVWDQYQNTGVDIVSIEAPTGNRSCKLYFCPPGYI
ncbi:hypothetical protein HOG98_00385 [bacterium]|jgi:hypothetical protein|nr:hypothetical protein [bacterium]